MAFYQRDKNAFSFIFLAMQHGMQALRSWTRARTHAHYRGADCGSDHELLIAR